MKLAAYPRPQNDTGIGFGYCPDASRYTPDSLHRSIVELRALGASWLALASSVDETLPDFFLRELRNHELEPVVGLWVSPIGPLDPPTITTLLQAYAAAGLRYVYFYRHPNLMRQWDPDDWLRPALVERFVEMLLPCLARAADLGLYPLLPPLWPGGDFWDTAFLEAVLEAIAQRRPALFDRMGIAIVSHTLGRSLAWGKGGPAQWKDAHPYLTPQGSENQRGLRLFEWYDEIVRRCLGYPLPLIAVEGGATFDSAGNPTVASDEGAHAEASIAMAQVALGGDLPDAVFCVNLGLLWASQDPGQEDAAWIKGDGRRLAAASALRAMAKTQRAFSWERAPKEPAIPYHKPLHHYLLLPLEGEGIGEGEWRAAQGYIRRFRPVIGFDPQEARSAEFVTIVGDGLGVSLEAERMLRAAGCKVERLSGRNWKETRRIMDALAKEGRRFASF